MYFFAVGSALFFMARGFLIFDDCMALFDAPYCDSVAGAFQTVFYGVIRALQNRAPECAESVLTRAMCRATRKNRGDSALLFKNIVKNAA
ncbi:MAG: hypothetical protein KKA05_04420 [Alphaproteobacteria bacterium]|nr:hypothetical protein [Alphaproteobacteria bacterium]MBU0859101.1 hypothetical protein [Alphaproteobacteria bacterium]